MGKGGGKGHGKSGGKIIASVGLALWGGLGATGMASNLFGVAAGHVFQGVMYGLALGSTIGSAFFSPKEDTPDTTQNFDAKMNQVDSSAMLPLVYGTRKVGGLQTYHKSDVKNKKLRKHVLMAEGEVTNMFGITANGYLLPYKTVGVKQPNATIAKKPQGFHKLFRKGTSYDIVGDTDGKVENPRVFSITNIKDTDAMISIDDSTIRLTANGHSYAIKMQSIEDLEDDASNDYRCTWGAFYQYVLGDNYENTLAEDGWRLINPINCNDYPRKIASIPSTNAYDNVVNVFAQDLVGHKSMATFHVGKKDEVPDTYKTTGGYPMVAYVDSTLEYCEEIGAGNPTLTALVMGRKCYDWRTGKTEYTENPVVCLYDYLTNPVYGLGETISEASLDMDSFTEIANYCDEPVKFTDVNGVVAEEPRYTLNLLLAQAQSHQDNLKAILRTFAGFIIFSNNKIKLCCERMQKPVYAFNDDNIVEKSIAYKSASIDQSPNRVNVKYIEPALDFTGVQCIVEDPTNQLPPPIGRGRIIEADIHLDGVTSQGQALRLGKIYRDIIRMCPITITFKTGAMAGMLEAGDVITVSKNYIDENGELKTLFENVPARIQEIKEDRGTYEITARQYNESIYDDSFGATLRNVPTNVTTDVIDLKPESTVPEVVDINITPIYAGNVDGQDYHNVRVAWSVKGNVDYLGARVYYRIKNTKDLDNPWSGELREGGMGKTEVLISQIPSGSIVRFYIYGIGLDGVEDESSVHMVEKEIRVNRADPLAPENCQLNINRDTATVTWNRVTNTDIYYYEVRLDTNKGVDENLLAKTNNTSSIVNLLERKGTIYVYAVNTLGVYSTPSVIEYNYPKPLQPQNVSVKSSMTGITVSCDASSLGKDGYNFYIDGTKYTNMANLMFFQLDAGIYRVSMSFSDYFGEGDKSDEVLATVNATIPTELIDKEKLGLTKIEDSMSKFDAEVGSFKEDISGMQSKMVQLSDGIQQSVKDINTQVESKITQLNDNINLRIEDATSGDKLVSQINLSSAGARIDGRLLHVTGDALFDNNIITKGMIQSGAITSDKLSADAIQGKTITGDQIKGGTINGINIQGVNIKGSRIDADSLYQSGFHIKNIDSAIYTVWDNNTVPVLNGYSESECIFIPAGVQGDMNAPLDRIVLSNNYHRDNENSDFKYWTTVPDIISIYSHNVNSWTSGSNSTISDGSTHEITMVGLIGRRAIARSIAYNGGNASRYNGGSASSHGISMHNASNQSKIGSGEYALIDVHQFSIRVLVIGVKK